MNGLSTMRAVDRRRMAKSPLLYILIGVSLAMPILILVMTTMVGGDGGMVFTNAWQAIASDGMGMDMTAMMNSNLLYFLMAVLVGVFISEDFRSGYAKNLFTIRAKKGGYVASKIITCSIGGALMLLGWYIGTFVGGSIAGLSFDTGSAGIFGVTMCMLSKIALVPLFVSIDTLISSFAKNRTWLAVCGSLAAGALLFTMVPMMTPLNSGVMNFAMCLVGGAIFAVAIGTVNKVVLTKSNLV